MDVPGLIDAIRTGGDVATFALLYLIWRLERRLYRLELLQQVGKLSLSTKEALCKTA